MLEKKYVVQKMKNSFNGLIYNQAKQRTGELTDRSVEIIQTKTERERERENEGTTMKIIEQRI